MKKSPLEEAFPEQAARLRTVDRRRIAFLVIGLVLVGLAWALAGRHT